MGGALRGARVRPQRVHPGQESPVPEKQELQTILLDGKVRSQGVGAGSQEGRGCPQAPRGTNRGPAPEGREPHTTAELPKRLQRAPGGPRSSSERRLRTEGAVHPGARFPRRRPWSPGRRGHSPGSCGPQNGRRHGGHRTARTVLPPGALDA